jgi:hypothetical protein
MRRERLLAQGALSRAGRVFFSGFFDPRRRRSQFSVVNTMRETAGRTPRAHQAFALATSIRNRIAEPFH